MESIRILGLDPGLRNTGWGVIQVQGNSLKPVAQGTVHTKSHDKLATRLNDLYQALNKVLQAYQPDEAVVEETFVNTNAVSTLKLGMARGVILLTPATFNIPVFEYSANKIKKAVVGVGHAQKDQVLMMVQRLLPTLEKGIKIDTADALAAAICHAHYRQVFQYSPF